MQDIVNKQGAFIVGVSVVVVPDGFVHKGDASFGKVSPFPLTNASQFARVRCIGRHSILARANRANRAQNSPSHRRSGPHSRQGC